METQPMIGGRAVVDAYTSKSLLQQNCPPVAEVTASEALESLQERGKAIHEAISRLDERLGSVLREQGPEPNRVDEGQFASCPMAKALLNEVASFRYAAERIDGLIARCGL